MKVTEEMQRGIEEATFILERHGCKVTTVLSESTTGIFAIYFISTREVPEQPPAEPDEYMLTPTDDYKPPADDEPMQFIKPEEVGGCNKAPQTAAEPLIHTCGECEGKLYRSGIPGACIGPKCALPTK